MSRDSTVSAEAQLPVRRRILEVGEHEHWTVTQVARSSCRRNEILGEYSCTSANAQSSKTKATEPDCQIGMRPLAYDENPIETREGLMVEKLETRSAPALAAINAFVRGSSARLCSSNKLGWDGVCLEHHRMFPGERNDSVSTHHLVVLCTSHVARGGNLMRARALRPLFLLSRRHETLFCRSDWRSQAIYRRHSDLVRPRP
jgi:hypothetical protein